jgi:hypothetical protein
MSFKTVDKVSSCGDDLRMKNKSLIYLKAQNRGELCNSERARACVNSQKITERLATKGVQLVLIVIPRICFYIGPDKYSHSITVNLMRTKRRNIERSRRGTLSSAKSSNDVRVY